MQKRQLKKHHKDKVDNSSSCLKAHSIHYLYILHVSSMIYNDKYHLSLYHNDGWTSLLTRRNNHIMIFIYKPHITHGRTWFHVLFSFLIEGTVKFYY